MKHDIKITPDSFPATTTENREIKLCIEWLQSVPTITKAINHHRSSYGWKHNVERWAGCYISNDSFIQAARQMGLMEAPKPGSSLNYCYNLKIRRK